MISSIISGDQELSLPLIKADDAVKAVEPLWLKKWWRVTHFLGFFIGGMTFIFGTLCYYFPKWTDGAFDAAFLYTLGSVGFLYVDLLEFFTCPLLNLLRDWKCGLLPCNFQCLDDVRTGRLHRRECLHRCVPDVEDTSVEPRGGGHQHLDPGGRRGWGHDRWLLLPRRHSHVRERQAPRGCVV